VHLDPGERTQPERIHPERRRAVLLLTAVAFVVRIGFTWPNSRPVLFGDEAAPLLIARWLLGVGAKPSFGNDAFYHPGYALLQVPFAWLSPGSTHRIAILVNCALLAALVPLADAIARRIAGATPRQGLAVAAVTSLYPAFLLQAGLTWAESAVIPVVLLVILAFDELLRRDAPAVAVLFGVATIGAYAVHARLLPLVLLAPVAVLVAHRRGALTREAAASTAATVVLGFVLVRVFNGHLRHALYLPGGAGSDEGDVVSRLLTNPLNLLRAVRALAGQLWYLDVATLGLAPLGALALADRARRSLATAYAAVACAALLAVAALFVVDPDRPDQRVYGRYAEAFVAVLLVAGMVELCRHPRRAPLRDELAAVAGIPLLLGPLLVLLYGGKGFHGFFNPFNVLGIEHLVTTWGFNVALLSAIGAGGGLLLLGGRMVLSERRAFLLLIVVAVWFAWGAQRTETRFVEPLQRARSATFTLPATLPVVEAAVQEDFRHASIDYVVGERQAQFFGMQLAYPDTQFVPWIRAKGLPSVGPWVVTTKSWPQGEAAGARLVLPESAGVHEAIWLLPGPLLERARAAGLVVEPGAGPLPPTELLGAAEPADDHLTMRPGRRLVTSVQVHNQSHVPWPATGDAPAPGVPVTVVATWFQDTDGGADVAVNVAELPHRLFPGERAKVELALVATRPDGSPLPTGNYVLRLSAFVTGGQKVPLESDDLLVTVR
jgi:hypothetical protein